MLMGKHMMYTFLLERDSDVISTVKIEGRNILYRVWTAVGFPFSGGRPHTHVPMDSTNWA